MRILRLPLSLTVATLLLASVGCGGDDFSIGHHPELQVSVQEDELSFQDEDGEVSFGQALQLPISKTISLRNTGNADLTLSEVSWEKDDQGALIHNPYVSLSFTESPSCSDGAVIAEKASCRFMVLYSPPVG